MYKQSIDTKETKEEIKKLIEKGNLEKAKLAIYDYLKVVPNDPDIYSMLGVIYFAEKDLNKAEEILLQGTMFDSRNFFLHYSYISVLTVHRSNNGFPWVQRLSYLLRFPASQP